MKSKKFLILAGLILASIGLTTCSNPIIEKWWNNEPYYVAIQQTVPIEKIIYQEVETIRPITVMESIKIINIEYVLFSGDASVVNGTSPVGGTDLTPEEIQSNNANMNAMAQALFGARNRSLPAEQQKDYMIIFHGHANPVDYTEAETGDLTKLSKDRAENVEQEVLNRYDAISPPPSPLPPTTTIPPPDGHDLYNRMTATWYGGERNLGSSSYPGLNRRVEMILIEITTETVTP